VSLDLIFCSASHCRGILVRRLGVKTEVKMTPPTVPLATQRKTPFFLKLTLEIENQDSYLVFLMLQQFLNYVVVVGAGG